VRRSESLIHDAAWATAKNVLAVVAPVLREEERLDALEEIFARVKTGMEEYHAKVIWLVTRIGSTN
jgi:hypothetical protein